MTFRTFILLTETLGQTTQAHVKVLMPLQSYRKRQTIFLNKDAFSSLDLQNIKMVLPCCTCFKFLTVSPAGVTTAGFAPARRLLNQI